MPVLDLDLEEDAAQTQDDLRPGDLRRIASRAVGAAERVATADALGRLLRQLQPEGRRHSDDSSSGGKALVDALSGLGGAFEGMGKAYKGLFENLTSSLTPKKGEGGDSGMALAVALIGALVPMFMGMMDQGNQRWQAVVEGRDKQYGEIITDLRRQIQERGGPSHYDQIAHGMVSQMFQAHMEEMVKPRRTMMEEIAETAETLSTARQHLERLGGGGSPVEYSEGALRHKELAIREQEVVHKAKTELERAKGNRAMWLALGRAGPAMAGELLNRGMAMFGLGVPQVGVDAAGVTAE